MWEKRLLADAGPAGQGACRWSVPAGAAGAAAERPALTSGGAMPEAMKGCTAAE